MRSCCRNTLSQTVISLVLRREVCDSREDVCERSTVGGLNGICASRLHAISQARSASSSIRMEG